MGTLASTGHLGLGMPKLAMAVGLGVSTWAQKAVVNVTAAGAVGVGVAGPLPLLVPQPLLLANIQIGFLSAGLMGFFSPLTVMGLANGLAQALPLGLILASVMGVGSGAGVALIKGPPAQAGFQEAFASFDMTGEGPTKLALALGLAFDQTFAAFIIPIPVVGPVGPAPGAGTGVGKIV